MSEEIKKEGETSEEEAEDLQESQNTETDDSESTEDKESVESESREDTDVEDEDFHKSELEKVQDRLGKKVDKEREKRIAAERAKGLTAEEVEKLVDKRVSGVVKGFQRSSVEDTANKLARTPEEKELILYHYDHSIVPTGNISEDIENAYALANKNKVRKQLSELNQSLKSKKARQGGSDAGAEIKPKPTFEITQEVRDAAKFAGVSPEKFLEMQDKK